VSWLFGVTGISDPDLMFLYFPAMNDSCQIAENKAAKQEQPPIAAIKGWFPAWL
jgi:hypothetical protein